MLGFGRPGRVLLVGLAIMGMISLSTVHGKEVEWVSQFGTSEIDYAWAVEGDTTGVYVAGDTDGTLTGEPPVGGGDVYVRKYGFAGNVIWTRQFGSSNLDHLRGFAVGQAVLYAVGETLGNLSGETSQGGFDAYIQKYDTGGNLVWTRQFGDPAEVDFATGVAVDQSGVYVVGDTGSTFRDCFIRKFDPDGNLVWAQNFGTTISDATYDIVVDSTGAYVIGTTFGTFAGASASGGRDGFVRKYNSTGGAVWTRQFGTVYDDETPGIAVSGTGPYVAGYTRGTLPGQTSAGGYDSFIQKYDTEGVLTWTRQFGTSGDDSVSSLAVDSTWVYAAGSTNGTFPGQANAGTLDATLLTLDTTGNLMSTIQFGTPEMDIASKIATHNGGIYIAGTTEGTFLGQTYAGNRDAFLVKLSDRQSPSFWEEYWYVVPAIVGGVVVTTTFLAWTVKRHRTVKKTVGQAKPE
jgi:hypothetical protein